MGLGVYLAGGGGGLGGRGARGVAVRRTAGEGPPGGLCSWWCAPRESVSASHLTPWQIGLLVLGGGATAWLAQMSAAIADPRGPERRRSRRPVPRSRSTCGQRAPGGGAGPAAGRRVAVAGGRRWSITSPPGARSAGALSRLRDANHALHVLFAEPWRQQREAGLRPPPPPTWPGPSALEADPAVVIGPDRAGRRCRRSPCR